MLFDEIVHRWSLEKRLRCLCNLSHLTACDWITQNVNTRCKQGHRDLWEAYVSCSLCCFPSECSVISRSMRACWLIIQSSLVFPLVHSAQKRQDTILWTSLAQNPTSIPWLMTLPFLLISLCLCQESSELKTIINSAKPNRSTVRSLHTCTHQPGA